MSRKIFNFALEDGEDELLDNQTSETTDDASVSDTDTPPDDVGADDQSASTDADGGESGEPEVDLHPDNEPADLTELNVQKLSEASKEEEDEELRKEHEEESRQGGEALSDMSTLIVAHECLANCLQTKHKGALALSQKVHADYREKHGLGPMRKKVALESYEEQETVAVAMESISDTIRTVITAIVSAIRKAVQWLKTWFKTYFSQTNLLMAGVTRAQRLFVEFRKKNGEFLDSYYKKNNIALDSFIQGFQYKSILSINGNQPQASAANSSFPTSYAAAFKDVLGLMDTNISINKYIEKGFLKTFELVEESLSDGKYPTETTTFFDPRSLIPVTYGNCLHIEGINPEPYTKLYGSQYYLGGKVAAIQVSTELYREQILNGMNRYANWKMWLKTTTINLPNGTMRYLTTPEAVAAYEVLEKIGKETLAFQKTSDQIEYVLDGLVVVLNKLSVGLTAANNSSDISDASITKNSDQLELATKTIEAAQAISAITQTYFAPLSGYTRDILRAWYEYIKITLETENAYITKARSEK